MTITGESWSQVTYPINQLGTVANSELFMGFVANC